VGGLDSGRAGKVKRSHPGRRDSGGGKGRSRRGAGQAPQT